MHAGPEDLMPLYDLGTHLADPEPEVDPNCKEDPVPKLTQERSVEGPG